MPLQSNTHERPGGFHVRRNLEAGGMGAHKGCPYTEHPPHSAPPPRDLAVTLDSRFRGSICVLGQAAWAAGGLLLNAVPLRATAFNNTNSLRITATSATFPVFPRFWRRR